MRTNLIVVLRAILLAATCGGTLGGCAALTGYPQDPLKSDAASALSNQQGSQSVLDQLTAEYFGAKSEDAYKAASVDARQAIRDDIVLNRIRVYDMEFSLFERDLSSTNNSISLGTDLTALALNGLGATTGDAATKAALAAASGGVIASNGAVNKDLFYQKTIPAIIAQMQADRQNVQATILTALHQSDKDYPLQRADLDLDKLNDAGSLNSAIANITQQASQSQTDSQNKVDSTTIARTANAVTVRSWLFPSGSLDQTRHDQLRDWLKNNADPDLHNVGVESFADDPTDKYEDSRADAISDLGIK